MRRNGAGCYVGCYFCPFLQPWSAYIVWKSTSGDITGSKIRYVMKTIQNVIGTLMRPNRRNQGRQNFKRIKLPIRGNMHRKAWTKLLSQMGLMSVGKGDMYMLRYKGALWMSFARSFCHVFVLSVQRERISVEFSMEFLHHSLGTDRMGFYRKCSGWKLIIARI